ncbi:hypothetical protein [Cellulomonas shaoxiangyii]|uniref:Uncharacterized protein n=1 Tax=Cellulomonas shaoxiangyii TaxID=2566013 RepID=A0A4P7SFV0_9CELL|nr:hypothetical protein [Cellulomonas shaoxiangyii]QCB92377.1 hypothetical protein E5225_01205 [Cellulomonas shaoxiangyii]TGY86229.1 hypothetical protein E5226_02660 [Cellulomonas shaoxiangyii]
MHTTVDPIVSAVPYEVLEVQGRTPVALTDFVGTVSVLLRGSTGEHVVCGQGTADTHTAVLQEKSNDGVGKDVRRWSVVADGDGFVAQTS